MGQVGEYVDRKEDIASYTERVELYFLRRITSKRISKLLRF